jgi:sialate O-acetylesterase
MCLPKMKKLLLLIAVFIYTSVTCFAQTKLPRFFSDSMVLQRNTDAVIWGTDIANKKIIVSGSWGKVDSVVSDNSGNWKLKLPTPAAGGPFTLTAIGSTTVIIKDVQIGEVWLCAGQSNMEMPMKGYLTSTPPQLVDSSAYFIANSSNTKLRVFMSGWNGTSRTPVNELSVGNWETASPASTPDFSATAYFFARKVQETLGIPIGIIVTARGGSSIESWMDSTTLASFEPVIIPTVVNWQDAQATPTIIYNTMLYPFIGFTIKGIIWSQGEANRSNYQEYQTLFTKLITSWRVQWNQGEFPFYFAQVAPNGGTTNLNAAGLREAQLNTMLTVSSTGMATTMDIGVQGLDHYPKKR